MFVACGIWCLADVSSVSPSSEQTERIVSLSLVYIPLTRRQARIVQSQSVFSSAKCRMLCKSGLLSRIVQSPHSVCFVCNSWCQ